MLNLKTLDFTNLVCFGLFKIPSIGLFNTLGKSHGRLPSQSSKLRGIHQFLHSPIRFADIEFNLTFDNQSLLQPIERARQY